MPDTQLKPPAFIPEEHEFMFNTGSILSFWGEKPVNIGQIMPAPKNMAIEIDTRIELVTVVKHIEPVIHKWQVN